MEDTKNNIIKITIEYNKFKLKFEDMHEEQYIDKKAAQKIIQQFNKIYKKSKKI